MDRYPLTPTERLLLMAAEVLGHGPSTDLSRANSVKICNLALRWQGLTETEARDGWWNPEPGTVPHQEVQATLVRMVSQVCREGPNRPPERPGEPLFEGGGNWGIPNDPTKPPASPHYTSCRLTPHGQSLARALLRDNPNLQAPVT